MVTIEAVLLELTDCRIYISIITELPTSIAVYAPLGIK